MSGFSLAFECGTHGQLIVSVRKKFYTSGHISNLIPMKTKQKIASPIKEVQIHHRGEMGLLKVCKTQINMSVQVGALMLSFYM